MKARRQTGPLRRTDRRALRRDRRFVLLTIVLMLGLNLPAAFFDWGWKAAAFNTGLTLVVFALYITRFRSRRLLAWLLFGLAAGFVELAADRWLVESTGSLVYPQDEPHLVVSPAYMPFAWAVILLQMGVVAGWLRDRLPVPVAAVATGLVCGLNIPLYEHLAKAAGWWYYRATPMVMEAPYYIIAGEFLIGLPLVWMAGRLRSSRHALGTAVLLGVVEGLVIWAAYALAWGLVGPCDGGLLRLPCE